jgi:SAM-dependent methyltransferase/uncharacterized protein YbaR (Trm112 family)
LTATSPYQEAQTILRCPITKQGLRYLNEQEITLFNKQIANGELCHNDGTQVKASLTAGFISSDKQFVYPVLDGIILLLENLAIPVSGSKGSAPIPLRAEKKVLQDFYDSIGWHKEKQGSASFIDADKWEDMRPVASEYIHNCHLRVNRYLKAEGHYLLDAGSGPVQYPEYLSYSDGYDFRVCVDLSFLALVEARKKLGDKGIYILGDITNIPIQDNTVDGAVSLHVIYHIPRDEQLCAFREIQRVLTPGSSAAIVYSWPNSTLMKWLMFPRRMNRKIRGWIQKFKNLVKKVLRWEKKRNPGPQASGPETPYRFTHDQAYFESNLKEIDFEIVVWRSITVTFMRTYIRPHLFGAAILRWIYRKEEAEPARYGRIGQYPLFVVRK